MGRRKPAQVANASQGVPEVPEEVDDGIHGPRIAVEASNGNPSQVLIAQQRRNYSGGQRLSAWGGFALAYNLGDFLRRLALPPRVKHWSLTTLREKLIEIGAKVVSNARYVIFQMAEVAVPRK